MKEKLSSTEKTYAKNSEAIYSIMRKVLLQKGKTARNCEYHWIIYLATNLKVISIKLVAWGTHDRIQVEPLDIFSPAFKHKCDQIVLVHSHPDGYVRPRKNDLAHTHKMYAIADFFGVTLVDHIIITEQQYYSFHDEGILKKIANDRLLNLSCLPAIKKPEVKKQQKKAYPAKSDSGYFTSSNSTSNTRTELPGIPR